VERELKSQQLLLQAVLVVLLVVLSTSTLALFHQIRWLVVQVNQLNTTSVELGRFVGDYETNVQPQLNRMIAELRRFADTNADFGRSFARYRIVADPPGAATNAPAAPRPR
jgi:hypothetical protein